MRTRVGRQEKLKAITLRLPASLYGFLTQHLHESNRSLNNEIVTRLQASIEFEHLLKMDNSDEVLEELGKLKRRLIDLRISEGTKK